VLQHSAEGFNTHQHGKVNLDNFGVLTIVWHNDGGADKTWSDWTRQTALSPPPPQQTQTLQREEAPLLLLEK
jgi:hypothetical protein